MSQVKTINQPNIQPGGSVSEKLKTIWIQLGASFVQFPFAYIFAVYHTRNIYNTRVNESSIKFPWTFSLDEKLIFLCYLYPQNALDPHVSRYRMESNIAVSMDSMKLDHNDIRVNKHAPFQPSVL